MRGGSASVPWDRYADRTFFGRDGEATFKRHSAEYDEFKDFFVKYQSYSKRSSKNTTAEDDLEYARKGMKLFKQYQEKRIAKLRDKITKDRLSLPVKPFEDRIVESVRKNQVTLIAADTGAGTFI
jgi:HrpA-like RNA helicase